MIRFDRKVVIPCGPAGPAGPTAPVIAGERLDEVCATIPIWLTGDFVDVRRGVATVGWIVGLAPLPFLATTNSLTKALSTNSDSIMGSEGAAGSNLGLAVFDPFGISVVFAL